MMKNNEGILFDKEVTRTYRDRYNVQCECDACLLFYKEFETQYADLVIYLRKFGIEVDYPLAAMYFPDEEDPYKHEYIVYYCVKGKLPADKMNDQIGSVHVTLRNWNVADEAYANTAMKAPYFIIELDQIMIHGHTLI